MKFKFLMIALFCPFLVFADGVLKVMNLPYTYLPLKSVSVTSRIEYQVAETITRQTYENNTGLNVKLKYGFPLDRQATVTRVRWLKGGIWYQGQIFERPQDTTAVNPGGLQDRQFLDYMGDNPFYLTFRDSLARDQQIVIELTYIELLEYDSRQIYFRYPLDLKHLINNQLDSFQIAIALKSTLPILNPASPSHPDCQIYSTASTAQVTYQNRQIYPDRDFILQYGTEHPSLNLILFSHYPEPDSGYFLMLFEPPVAENPGAHHPIAAIFVVDISGSMAGIKLDQAKSIINKALSCLSTQDYINFVVFNEAIKSFQNTPVPNTPVNRVNAQYFLSELTGTGKTELNGALNSALQQNIPALIRPVVILITDGQIEGQLGEINNLQNIPVFIWGLGQTIDRILLTKIAQENGGFVEFPRKDNFDRSVESFFSKICHPFLTEISLEFSGTPLKEIYPTHFSNLFAGEQMAITGRSSSQTKMEIKLTGKQDGLLKSWNFTTKPVNDTTAFPFVPKLWAKMKIDELLIQLRNYELNTLNAKKIINDIVYLGLKYSIITPYTSYIDEGTTSATENDSYFEPPALPHLPEACRLEQNFPNPFNSETSIKFTIFQHTSAQFAHIAIYNLLGEQMITFRIPISGTGNYQIKWDGLNEFGQPLPTGVYFYRLQIGTTVWQRKLLLLK